jgi:predicted SprT family Zn-dependent metalloprotease
MAVSNHRLRCLYRSYNVRFFGSSLSHDVHIIWDALPGWCAEVRPTDHAFDIRINPAYATDICVVKQAILHEMAHISLHPYSGHGRPFQDEIARLFALGAYKGLL